jgi:hypothetical protein
MIDTTPLTLQFVYYQTLPITNTTITPDYRKAALLKQKEYLKKRKLKKQARVQEQEAEREKDKKKWINFSVSYVSTSVHSIFRNY